MSIHMSLALFVDTVYQVWYQQQAELSGLKCWMCWLCRMYLLAMESLLLPGDITIPPPKLWTTGKQVVQLEHGSMDTLSIITYISYENKFSV